MKDNALPEPDQERVRKSFRRGLATYHQHASVQAEIAAGLVTALQDAGAPAQLPNVFEFGCGTGHLTARLLRGFDIGDLTLNDLVAEAAAELDAVLQPHAARSRFLPGPVEEAALPGGLDLIASASTVQWVADVPALLQHLSERLAPGGWLALSGFGRRQFHELAAVAPVAAAPSYADAGEWAAMLPPELELLALRQDPVVMQFASALELLRHLRNTGVNGQARQNWSRSRLRQFEDRYRAHAGSGGALPLTYDPVIMIARKPAP